MVLSEYPDFATPKADHEICAVPVLPATLYPGICALLANPFCTTLTSIEVICEAARGVMACFWFRFSFPSTTYGFGRAPLLASAEKAFATCRGVISIPWPKEAVAKFTSYPFRNSAFRENT